MISLIAGFNVLIGMVLLFGAIYLRPDDHSLRYICLFIAFLMAALAVDAMIRRNR